MLIRSDKREGCVANLVVAFLFLTVVFSGLVFGLFWVVWSNGESDNWGYSVWGFCFGSFYGWDVLGWLGGWIHFTVGVMLYFGVVLLFVCDCLINWVIRLFLFLFGLLVHCCVCGVFVWFLLRVGLSGSPSNKLVSK